MSAWLVAWRVARILRWAFWLGFLGFCLYFISDRTPHFSPLGQLAHHAEAFLFGLPLAAVIAGFMELLCRERLGGGLASPQR